MLAPSSEPVDYPTSDGKARAEVEASLRARDLEGEALQAELEALRRRLKDSEADLVRGKQ